MTARARESRPPLPQESFTHDEEDKHDFEVPDWHTSDAQKVKVHSNEKFWLRALEVCLFIAAFSLASRIVDPVAWEESKQQVLINVLALLVLFLIVGISLVPIVPKYLSGQAVPPDDHTNFLCLKCVLEYTTELKGMELKGLISLAGAHQKRKSAAQRGSVQSVVYNVYELQAEELTLLSEAERLAVEKAEAGLVSLRRSLLETAQQRKELTMQRIERQNMFQGTKSNATHTGGASEGLGLYRRERQSVAKSRKSNATDTISED